MQSAADNFFLKGGRESTKIQIHLLIIIEGLAVSVVINRIIQKLSEVFLHHWSLLSLKTQRTNQISRRCWSMHFSKIIIKIRNE